MRYARITITAIAALIGAQLAEGQDSTVQQQAKPVKHVQVDTFHVASVTSCEPGAPNRTIKRCGMALGRRKLLRGTPPIVIDRQRNWFQTLELSRFVFNDSAYQYALLYQSNTHRANTLKWIGISTLMGSWVFPKVVKCHDPTCVNRRNALSTTNLGIGIVSMGLSIPFQIAATRAGNRAIWWENSTMEQK